MPKEEQTAHKLMVTYRLLFYDTFMNEKHIKILSSWQKSACSRVSSARELNVLTSITHTTTQVSWWGGHKGPLTQEKQKKEVITSKPTSKVPNTNYYGTGKQIRLIVGDLCAMRILKANRLEAPRTALSCLSPPQRVVNGSKGSVCHFLHL